MLYFDGIEIRERERERERERKMRVSKKREKFDTTFDVVNVLVRMLYFVKRKC